MRNGRSILLSALLLALLWWLLVGHSVASWLVAVPAIAIASWLAWHLKAPHLLRFDGWALLRFLPLFLRESVQGGVTVAWRVLSPRLEICPQRVNYRCTLQQPAARVFFILCVNLLPGTLVVHFRGDDLKVHLLDCANDAVSGMAELEQAVAAIFPEPCQPEVSP